MFAFLLALWHVYTDNRISRTRQLARLVLFISLAHGGIIYHQL